MIQGNRANVTRGPIRYAAALAVVLARRSAYLNLQPAANLPVNSEGADFADYAVFTGVNPFSLNDSRVLLFTVGMSTLNNGAE